MNFRDRFFITAVAWLTVGFVYSAAYGGRCGSRIFLKPACDANFVFFNGLIFGETNAEPYAVLGLLSFVIILSLFMIGKEAKKAIINRMRH